jgi:hypothetical protein
MEMFAGSGKYVSATGNGEDRDEDQENEEDEPPNQVW